MLQPNCQERLRCAYPERKAKAKKAKNSQKEKVSK
jgi:hypothetical protein